MAGPSLGALIAMLVVIVTAALMPEPVLEDLSDFGRVLFLGLGADPVGQ